MKIKKFKLLNNLLITFLLFASPLIVNAADDNILTKKVCLSNRQLYSVNWDKTKNTLVEEEMVTEEAIKRGYTKDVTGMSEEDKIKYQITPIYTSGGCYIENGEILTCPSDQESSTYNMSKLLDTDESNEFKYVKMDFNINTGKFTVRIKDLYNGKVKLRAVTAGQPENNGGQFSWEFTSGFVSKNGDYFEFYNLNPSTTEYDSEGNIVFNTSKLKVEFYIDDNTSKCNGLYLTTIEFIIDTIDDIQIDNPALKDNSYGCATVKEFINNLLRSGYIPNNSAVESAIKSNYAYLCYTSKISYEEYKNLKANIAKQYANLQTLLMHGTDSGFSNIDMNGDVTCQEEKTTGEKVVIAEGGKWWSLVCKEKYEIAGDKAKLVYAGAGFKYTSTFRAIRTCTIKQNAIVVKKPKCQYHCDHICSWYQYTDASTGQNIGWHEETGENAGPTEEFDSCVNTCDGGKYTQECINSCYEEVYSNTANRQLPILDSSSAKSKTFSSDSDIRRTSTIVSITTDPTQGTYVVGGDTIDGTGRLNRHYLFEYPKRCSNRGETYTMSDFCGRRQGKCVVTETVGPSGCVDDPDGLYNQEMGESISEFGSMIGKMNKIIADGNYEINIADSYLNNNGVAYTYTVSTKENADIKTSSTSGNSCSGTTRVWKLGDSSDHYVSHCDNNVTTKEVKVELVPSYLDRKNGNAIYLTSGSNKYKKFNASSASTKLESTTINRNSIYSGGRKYYTSILSDNVNVIESGEKVTLVGYDQYFSSANKKATITVSVSDFGTNGDYSSQVDCFYGVYNNTLNKCVYPCKEVPDDGEGLTIIFRPIDLNDNFPNDRNPRWNWTDKASVTDTNSIQYSLLNYKVSPSELNKQIEEKGYNIYTDTAEVDYDIVLTPENLRNIKQYNKKVDDINKDGSSNYLDYDMTCGTRRNREYCYSNFLDNTNYVTYNTGFNATTRKDIAICNNTYDQACTN